ncbi:hypothetical protein J1N35_001101 [Gossypium stocksii]|uniref:Uncharacterized protein n=1 Tax=Gossypium stocksii TaxID=47602 RepID=A0A9D4ALC4_9ROSI|nr:hypothetical protein J1N35_001101 [Gossypium stocksii]
MSRFLNYLPEMIGFSKTHLRISVLAEKCQQNAPLVERFCHVSKKLANSSITVDGKLLEGSGFLARSHYRPGVQVGSETYQRVNREMETRDAHIPSSIKRVYYYFRGRPVIIRIASGWVCTHRVCSIC